MVQALLNNLNTQVFPQSSAQKMSDVKTDFQKLFDKQKSFENNEAKVNKEQVAEQKASKNNESEKEVCNDLSFNKTSQSENKTSGVSLSKEDNAKSGTEETTSDEEQILDVLQTSPIFNIAACIKVASDTNMTENCEKVSAGEIESANIEDVPVLSFDNNEIATSLNELEEITLFNSKNQAKTETNIDAEAKSLEEMLDEDMLKELNIESVKSEVSEDNSNSFMQQESAQESGVKAALQMDVDFSDIKFETKLQDVSVQQSVEVPATPGKIIEQISKQMDKLFNGSKLEMVLNPEALGKITIQLINTKEGLTAQFVATTQEARNLIMKGMEGLKENLISQGINVESVSVKLNDTQESEYNPDWTEQESSGNGNKNQNPRREQQKDKESFENAMSLTDEENGKV